MKLTPEQIRALARATVSTRPEEIDCDEWLARIASYLEAVHQGQRLTSRLHAVTEHLEVCADCREELEAILKALDTLP